MSCHGLCCLTAMFSKARVVFGPAQCSVRAQSVEQLCLIMGRLLSVQRSDLCQAGVVFRAKRYVIKGKGTVGTRIPPKVHLLEFPKNMYGLAAKIHVLVTMACNQLPPSFHPAMCQVFGYRSNCMESCSMA